MHDEYGVPASVTVGQSILESNWGASTLTVNDRNFFGFKCVSASDPGPIATGCHAYPTTECTPTCHTVTAYFRVYASEQDSFRDYGRLLTTSSVYAGALQFENDPNAFIEAIAPHYATDPNYANEVINLMTQYNLYQFDQQASAGPVVSYAGTLQAFARDASTGHLLQRAYDGTKWLGWNDLGGNISGAPVAVSYDGTLQVFARGAPSGHLFQLAFDGTKWLSWTDLGGVISGSPAVTTYGRSLQVFARGAPSGHLFQLAYDGTKWLPWADLGGLIGGSPAVTTYGSTVQVFAQGEPSGHLFQLAFNGTKWLTWADFGGSISSYDI